MVHIQLTSSVDVISCRITRVTVGLGPIPIFGLFIGNGSQPLGRSASGPLIEIRPKRVLLFTPKLLLQALTSASVSLDFTNIIDYSNKFDI